MALRIQTKILSRNRFGWKGTLRTDKLCCDIKETEENSPPLAWCQRWGGMNKSKTPGCHFWGGVTHRHRHPSVPNYETVLPDLKFVTAVATSSHVKKFLKLCKLSQKKTHFLAKFVSKYEITGSFGKITHTFTKKLMNIYMFSFFNLNKTNLLSDPSPIIVYPCQ